MNRNLPSSVNSQLSGNPSAAETISGSPISSASETHRTGNCRPVSSWRRRAHLANQVDPGNRDHDGDRAPGRTRAPGTGLGPLMPRLWMKTVSRICHRLADQAAGTGRWRSARTGTAAAAGRCGRPRYRRRQGARSASYSTGGGRRGRSRCTVASTMPISRDEQRVHQADDEDPAMGGPRIHRIGDQGQRESRNRPARSRNPNPARILRASRFDGGVVDDDRR